VVSVRGRPYLVDRHWVHRLVRSELDFEVGRIRLYTLRRRAPTEQPLLAKLPYAPQPARRYRQ
jgi:hypothetical protein